jgi:hypothetical protein
MYPGEGHNLHAGSADAVSEGDSNGLLAQRPTLVNLHATLTTFSEPSDLLQLKDNLQLGSTEGKKSP